MTRSRSTAAHSMTKLWLTDGEARRDWPAGATKLPSPVHAHVHRRVAFHRTGDRPRQPARAALEEPLRVRKRRNSSATQHDHQRAADELGEGELPADQQRQDQPELDDEVGGGELERHRRGEVGALAEQRSGQRDRCVGAGRRRGAEARSRSARLRGRSSGSNRGDRGLADERLDDRGQREPEDQRPGHLPRHRAGFDQGVQGRVPQRCHALTLLRRTVCVHAASTPGAPTI